MESIILTDIPVALDVQALSDRLHLRPGSGTFDELAALVAEAESLARPKAMCRLVYVTARDGDSVALDGIPFTSRVLTVNLNSAHRAFAFVATCGVELHAWSESLEDVLHQYWAEAIKEAALRRAMRALGDAIERFDPGKLVTMNPGSLMDWPLRQQRPLFELMGDPLAAIGVELTESCLMVPNKSVSGLRFPTEVSFESCQLCPRRDCPGRRAPYDSELYEQRYAHV
jgi:hypothetical protein